MESVFSQRVQAQENVYLSPTSTGKMGKQIRSGVRLFSFVYPKTLWVKIYQLGILRLKGDYTGLFYHFPI